MFLIVVFLIKKKRVFSKNRANVRVTGMSKLRQFCNPHYCSSVTTSDATIAFDSCSSGQSKKFLS